MVNLYGLYMAVVFLCRFRLQVVPLSLGTSYSLSALCMTHQKNFTLGSSYGHHQRTNRKRQYFLSNSNSALCEAKGICGTMLPRVTVLALFYESVNPLVTDLANIVLNGTMTYLPLKQRKFYLALPFNVGPISANGLC